MRMGKEQITEMKKMKFLVMFLLMSVFLGRASLDVRGRRIPVIFLSRN